MSAAKLSHRGLPAITLVAFAAALFLVHAWALRFTQDDAYISLQYARNLVEGNGLVFNIGERVEGYTNFAWTLILALLLKLQLPALVLTRVVGALSGAAAIVLAARFARGVENRWGPVSVATAVLAAASSPFALWSASGMETGFHTLLVTLALVVAFAPEPSSRTRRNASMLFALATLSRPDAPVLFAAWVAVRAVDVARRAAPPGDSVRALARDVGFFVAPLVPWLLWKLAYYGDLLPNTYYAKTGLGAVYVARGLAELKDYVLAYGAFGVAPVLALFATRHPQHGARLARLAVVLAAHATYVVFGAGGDVLPFFRFWVPIVPLGCALTAIGAAVLFRRFGGRLRLRPAWTVGIVATCLAALGLFSNWKPIDTRRRIMDDVATRALGRWFAENLGPNDAIAATPIGAVAYYSRRPVIDMLGLVDREIARNPETLPGVTDTWKEKRYNAASVLRRRPAAILFSTGVRPSAAGEQALFLYEYFHQSYYALFVRADPRFGTPTTIYRLRDDAPPVPDPLRPVEERAFLEHWCQGLIASLVDDVPQRAEQEFHASVTTAPPFFLDGLEWWASTRYQLGDTTAVDVMKELLRLDPYAFVAYMRLGDYYVTRGQLDEGERMFSEYVARNPFDAMAWQALAQISYQRGRLSEGLERVQRSVQLWSTNPQTWALRANMALASGRLDIAEESLRRILDINPNSTDARDALAAVIARRSSVSPAGGAE